MQITEIIDALLLARGVDLKNKVEFLNPTLPPLVDLIASLKVDPEGLRKAKVLIDNAIADKQNICVYGDYDADGITATGVMWQTLNRLGGRVLPFIPSRTRHGYGLSDSSVKDLLSGTAFESEKFPGFIPDLIITVDNGIVASEQIKALRQKGLKVIVTDHHVAGSHLPPCDALVHTTLTSGAGISWLVARYLTDDDHWVSKRLDLATLGIVADQMPVSGVNRSLIKHGLKAIEQSSLVGLRALLAASGTSSKALTTYDLNFILGPRINAVGRIDNALSALRLLCTNNQAQANELSQQMEALNEERKVLTETAITDAIKKLDDNKITLVASPTYHHGVIGLIASKLAEKTHKPAVAMSINNTQVKGSARSVSGFNITALLRRHQALLTSVGGHEQAAGFSLPLVNLDQFVAALTKDANETIPDELLVHQITADLELPLESTSLKLASELSCLEPYGIGNPRPRFISHNLNVLEDQALGEGGKHRKLKVEQGGAVRTVLWFNGEPCSGTIKSLVYSLDINIWKSRRELQLVASYVQV